MAARPRLRGYVFFEPIGAGAESVIYRARDVARGRIVAVKDVLVDAPEKYKYLRHVCNEYRMLRQLKTGLNGTPIEGVVQVYRLIRSGLFRRRKRCALVMQYVEGHDLRKERRYPYGQLVDIIYQVADTLCVLHGKRIVHGDIKPENVIVDYSGKATLVDFGFSCPAGSMVNSIRGTRDYMAPEQVDMGRITPRTDIYNFGATIYYVLTEHYVPALMPAQGDRSHFIAMRSAEPRPPRQ